MPAPHAGSPRPCGPRCTPPGPAPAQLNPLLPHHRSPSTPRRRAPWRSIRPRGVAWHHRRCTCPRPNAMADPDVTAFLAAHPAARLVTVGPDGRPRLHPAARHRRRRPRRRPPRPGQRPLGAHRAGVAGARRRGRCRRVRLPGVVCHARPSTDASCRRGTTPRSSCVVPSPSTTTPTGCSTSSPGSPSGTSPGASGRGPSPTPRRSTSAAGCGPSSASRSSSSRSRARPS